MKKLKWYGIVFSLFVLFLYIMGSFDIFMMLSHNVDYYNSKGYGDIVIKYFTNYPIYLLVFWIGNLICGLLSPIMYLVKSKESYLIALISFLCDFILVILGIIFRNRINVLGINIFYFDLFILIITLLFGIYLYFYSKSDK